MKFNDREVAKIAEGKVDLEGVLHYMRPQEKDWSDWYQQPSFKERYFKLISNMLFYYRVNDQEPSGMLVLENAQVAYEHPHKGIPFAFSITFKVNDKYKEGEYRHIFSCRCQNDVNKWVAALKMASYEYWQSQLTILKTKLSMKTGRDPVLDYLREKNSNSKSLMTSSTTKNVCAKKSSFRSHIHTKTISETSTSTATVTKSGVVLEKIKEVTKNQSTEAVPVGNLIDL